MKTKTLLCLIGFEDLWHASIFKKAGNEDSLPVAADGSLFQCKSAVATHSLQNLQCSTRLWVQLQGGYNVPHSRASHAICFHFGEPKFKHPGQQLNRERPEFRYYNRGPKLMTCFSPKHWIPTYISTTKPSEVDKGPSIILGMNPFSELQKQSTVLVIPLNSTSSP